MMPSYNFLIACVNRLKELIASVLDDEMCVLFGSAIKSLMHSRQEVIRKEDSYFTLPSPSTPSLCFCQSQPQFTSHMGKQRDL